MVQTTLAVAVGIVTTVALVVGGRLAVAAHRACRRAESHPLRLLSYGLGLVTAGIGVGGVLAFPLDVGAGRVVLLQDLLVGLGLLVLFGALHASRSDAGG
jgi:predicted acyltransferase